jgi:hypothetical protein
VATLTGDRGADLAALMAYPFEELKLHAASLGVKARRSKQETASAILEALYEASIRASAPMQASQPPPPTAPPPGMPVSVRVGRILGR